MSAARSRFRTRTDLQRSTATPEKPGTERGRGRPRIAASRAGWRAARGAARTPRAWDAARGTPGLRARACVCVRVRVAAGAGGAAGSAGAWARGRRGGAGRGGAGAARPGAKGLSAAAAPAPSAAGCKQTSLSLSCLAAARSRSPEPGAVTRDAPDRGSLAAPGSAPHGHSEGAPRQGG